MILLAAISNRHDQAEIEMLRRHALRLEYAFV